MPKLYGNSPNWRNVLSEDGSELYEVADKGRNEDWISADYDADERILRIILLSLILNHIISLLEYLKMGRWISAITHIEELLQKSD